MGKHLSVLIANILRENAVRNNRTNRDMIEVYLPGVVRSLDAHPFFSKVADDYHEDMQTEIDAAEKVASDKADAEEAAAQKAEAERKKVLADARKAIKADAVQRVKLVAAKKNVRAGAKHEAKKHMEKVSAAEKLRKAPAAPKK